MKEENTEAKSCTCCCSSKETVQEKDYKLHWNKAFDRSDVNNLGWYEENPQPSFDLIKKCNLKIDSSILNVGAGASTLVDELVNLGYENIIANDLSSSALNKLKERLGNDSDKVEWIEDDLTNPSKLNKLENIELWHDRAVLHFFNDKKDQDTYFALINKVLKKNGYVIIAAFHLNGAPKCCGLPVHRYDENMLKERIGNNFELLESFEYTFLNPSGDPREYIYTLFKRIN
ncbi:MAG: methyltransferase domain-containing protein [Bacteroidales bacterium]|nr:methyltransferase domain-containing protein [Bacteroidales bacterium]